MSGEFMISTTVPFNFFTIAGGVPVGANSPYQLSSSYPGRPDSATVGTPGKAGVRCSVVTASALSLPLFTRGPAVSTFVIAS